MPHKLLVEQLEKSIEDKLSIRMKIQESKILTVTQIPSIDSKLSVRLTS